MVGSSTLRAVLAVAAVSFSSVAGATTLSLVGASDDGFEAYLSTTQSAAGLTPFIVAGTWTTVYSGQVELTPGVEQFLLVASRDIFGPPSMWVAQATLSDNLFRFPSGGQFSVTSAADWTVSLQGFGGTPVPVVELGRNGTMVWGTRPGISTSAQHIWSNPTGAGGEQYFMLRITPVPEPGTLALAAAGLAVLMGASRRRA